MSEPMRCPCCYSLLEEASLAWVCSNFVCVSRVVHICWRDNGLCEGGSGYAGIHWQGGRQEAIHSQAREEVRP